MPSTPVSPAPDSSLSQSSRQTNDECRSNAIKNRRENEWFSHEFKSSMPSPVSSSTDSVRKNQKSGEWYTDQADSSNNVSVTGVSSTVNNATPESRKIQQKVYVGSQQDWYKHGDKVPDPPSLTSRPKSRRSTCNETKTETCWVRSEWVVPSRSWEQSQQCVFKIWEETF